jgi:hypothetical protein
MAQTPQGGHRDTQWVIQYRKVKTEPDDGTTIPAEELLWNRHAIAQSGAATKQALKEFREETSGLEWRAVRIETTQRVEDW